VVVVGYAAVVGVGIDLDHFLVARYNAGDWRALRRCLRRPRIVLFDQGAIFETLDVNPVERLLSHVVIAGVLVGALWLVSPYFARVTGVVLYAHLLADLVADTLEFPETARRYVRARERSAASDDAVETASETPDLSDE
jgi:hypothetical protein